MREKNAITHGGRNHPPNVNPMIAPIGIMIMGKGIMLDLDQKQKIKNIPAHLTYQLIMQIHILIYRHNIVYNTIATVIINCIRM